MVNNESIDSATKIKIYGLIGVCEGSFKYWSENVDSWTSADWYNNGNTFQFQGISKATKKKIAELVNADAGGAGFGMAAGALLGGIGAGPGAVLMGSWCSGVVAWSW